MDVYFDEEILTLYIREIFGSVVGDEITDFLVVLGEERGMLYGFYELLVNLNTFIHDIYFTHGEDDDDYEVLAEGTISIPNLTYITNDNIPFAYDTRNETIFIDEFEDIFFENSESRGCDYDEKMVRAVEELMIKLFRLSTRFYKNEGAGKYYVDIELFGDGINVSHLWIYTLDYNGV